MTKECPSCGKNMIQWRTKTVLTSIPPQYPWIWRCGCGNRLKGGVFHGLNADNFREEWDKAQEVKP